MTVYGNHVAMITPMNEGFGVDYTGARDLAEYLVRRGAHGLLVAGATGECFSLTSAERHELAETIMSVAGSKVAVGVHVSHNVTAEAVTLAEHAQRINAAYVLISPPSSSSGGSVLVEHILSVARSVTVPVMVYDGGDGIPIPIPAYDTLLASTSNISYSKVNVSEAAKVAALRARFGDRLVSFVGKDDQTMLGLQYGAKGFVCATSNLLPGVLSQIYTEYTEGHVDRARAAYYQHVAPLVVAIFATRHLFIQMIKVGLQSTGVIKHHAVRPCLVAPDDIHVREFRRALAVVGLRSEGTIVA